MADRNLVEIRIAGDNNTPDKVSSKDVGELITAFETMLAALIARNNPTLGIDESEITIGLARVEYGSYRLGFQSQLENEMIAANLQVTTSINTGDYANLPKRVIEGVETVRKIARKYATDIEIWQRNGKDTPLATVNTNTRIDVSVPTLQAKTTLYGTVIRVGGIEPPRVALRQLTGSIVNCHITRSNDLQIARQLGQRLYTEVGVYGTGRWDLRDMSLDHFLIERLTEYSKKPIGVALEGLYAIVGKSYESIDDIDQLVAEIRGTDEEEI